ncbi:hypothetical protein CUR178_04437 [Leishmania enriettii]|uniref:Uncharacterized protein n=1 Tax=Leishmania enriettii TaxID=5663 RepID=A0A836G4I8_LEIEN|nr:hypothetical protein CUR178_04437 [Leishmania enriettii]
MVSWTRRFQARWASPLRYEGEVVNFSSDAQTGLVRLVTRLCSNTAAALSGPGAAAARDEEFGRRCRAARVAQCVPFSSKQVFASATPLSADATQDEDALEATATCTFPCYISCGCPAVVHVSPGYHDSSPFEGEATSVSCPPPSLQVRRLYVHNPSDRKVNTRDTRRTSYYVRLPDACFQCWQEHNKVVGEFLDTVEKRPPSPLKERFMGLTSLDIEVLELLNLTKTLGCAAGGCGATSVDLTRKACSDGTIEGVPPMPTM